MFTTGAGIFHPVQSDFLAEAANIAAVVFPETQFQVLSQKIGSDHAALILPQTQFQLLAHTIGNDNLSVTFKGKHFSENFRLRFFPNIKTLIVSGYYKEGMAHLIYVPPKSYNWLNGKKYQINAPSSIGEKFEFLASNFYPFLEEFLFQEPLHISNLSN